MKKSFTYIITLLFVIQTAFTQEAMKGFIVSDSHFGWLGSMQPSIEEQQAAMATILKRFNDLDAFFDTGDAVHNYAKDRSRGDWTDVIAGGCGTVPFFFIVGNHENNTSLTVDATRFNYDSEYKSNAMASVVARPYYSIDVKGVHIIMLPELMNQAYITEESQSWLKLDLELNKDKTTLIMSHNALKEHCVECDDKGYRTIANTDALLKIFKNYPNVKAWMYGHNHSYEILPINNMVFVSNGRIGGFSPGNKPGKYLGHGHLGGIYFEVGSDYLTIKCYSASENKFMDEFEGVDGMSWTLREKTSFDANASFAHYYGAGNVPDGQKVPIFNHFLNPEEGRTLFLAGTANNVINENADLSVYTQRNNPDWCTKHLAGYSFLPNEENETKSDNTWEFINPGVKLLKRKDAKETKAIYTPDLAISQRSYYKLKAGKKYKVSLDMSTLNRETKVQFVCQIHDLHFNRIREFKSKILNLEKGKQQKEYVFNTPDLKELGVLQNFNETDNTLHFAFGAIFSGITEDVVISRFEITDKASKSYQTTVNPELVVNGKSYLENQELSAGQYLSIPMENPTFGRSVIEAKVKGNGKLSWLIKESNPNWQVRNSIAVFREGKIYIEKLRNSFTAKEETIIVPLKNYSDPYVHRVRHVEALSILPYTENQLTFTTENLSAHGFGEVDIIAEHQPLKVIGTKDWEYKKNILTLKVKRYSDYQIIFK